jgi:hypothetical protein
VGIYDEGELSPEATVKQYLTVQSEGSRRQVDSARHKAQAQTPH